MLLLAQEFSINNVIKVWDTLLADHERYTFLNFICIAMVTYRRDTILKNEFGECLEILQKQLNPIDDKTMQDILNTAKRVCLKVTRKYENYIEA